MAQVPMAANRVATEPYAEVQKGLTSLARIYLPKDFYYTSIQLNLNYAAALHTDNNNMGKSYIIGMGNYTGGQLYVETRGTLDIKHKFTAFNGLLPHMTVNIHGAANLDEERGSFEWKDRWSAVFFCNSVASKLHLPEHKEDLEELQRAGYNTPPPGHFDDIGGDVNKKAVRRELGTPKQMLEKAKKSIVAQGGDPCGSAPDVRLKGPQQTVFRFKASPKPASSSASASALAPTASSGSARAKKRKDTSKPLAAKKQKKQSALSAFFKPMQSAKSEPAIQEVKQAIFVD